MRIERSVLVVSPTSQLSKSLVPILQRAGYRLMVAKTFHSAKGPLTHDLDLLITELKLGEYNGLQLALRGRTIGVPAIVIAEQAFEPDIEQLGATWISPEAATGDELQAVIARVLQDTAVADGYPWHEGTDSTTNARALGNVSPLIH